MGVMGQRETAPDVLRGAGACGAISLHSSAAMHGLALAEPGGVPAPPR